MIEKKEWGKIKPSRKEGVKFKKKEKGKLKFHISVMLLFKKYWRKKKVLKIVIFNLWQPNA